MSKPSGAAPAMVRAQSQRQGGPPLWVLAVVYGVLMLIAVGISAGSPQPGADDQAVLAYQRGHAGALQVAAFLWFGSSIPLAIWAATAYRRLRMLGVTAPGTAIGFAGGLLAANSVAMVGLVTWVRSQLGDLSDPGVARLLGDLGFALGAAGYAAPFALLLAGVAVPALILRLLPRWLAWTGLTIAVIGMVATLTLLTPALDLTLPVLRFGGLLWLIVASLLLPRTRPRRFPPKPLTASTNGVPGQGTDQEREQWL